MKLDLPAINYPIYTGTSALKAFATWLSAQSYSQVMVLTDDNTMLHCLPHLREVFEPEHAISISPGEPQKNLYGCMAIWTEMTERGFDRKSLMVNLGGGLIGDIGGFCAATYKRGIDFVQVPTSLLAQVDASVGGKTGINFKHYKNHLGAFRDPAAVFAHPGFFATLPPRELLSGYAEVLKHCLIADRNRWESLAELPYLPEDITPVIADSIAVKARIVAEDPFEKGIRKALNFGHTIGHGIESVMMDDAAPIPEVTHGEAVAAGMLAEAFISREKGLLTEPQLIAIAQRIRSLYPAIAISPEAATQIADTALQDKKNEAGRILCTLLEGIGSFRINVPITRPEILASLAFYHAVYTE
ncbi:MAG: 3-dehydroquinate synthase [Bacteroidota bacterium]